MRRSGHLPRAQNQAPDPLLEIGVVALVLDESLEPGPLLVESWVALDIVEFREIRLALWVPEQVLGSHHYQGFPKLPVNLKVKWGFTSHANLYYYRTGAFTIIISITWRRRTWK